MSGASERASGRANGPVLYASISYNFGPLCREVTWGIREVTWGIRGVTLGLWKVTRGFREIIWGLKEVS